MTDIKNIPECNPMVKGWLHEGVVSGGNYPERFLKEYGINPKADVPGLYGTRLVTEGNITEADAAAGAKPGYLCVIAPAGTAEAVLSGRENHAGSVPFGVDGFECHYLAPLAKPDGGNGGNGKAS